MDFTRGFLPAKDPLACLPEAFAEWESLARALPKLLLSDQLRSTLSSAAPFPVDALAGDAQYQRAMVLLSYLGHAYVWGEAQPATVLPANLAKPWHQVASKLGRLPVLSYASYALHNWYRLEPDGPIAVGNIALIQNFMAGMDEEWFILIHVDIEAKASPALQAIPRLLEAVNQGDQKAVQHHLQPVANALTSICDVLDRMPEHCDPYVYYRRVRPYIHAWKDNPALPEGLVYEGVDEYQGAPQQFRGETGAQSSLIPALDALLGIVHGDDPLKHYLIEMRDYMPAAHRAFIQTLEQGAPLREFVQASADPELLALYNQCIELMVRFRSTHLKYASAYINQQAQTSEANSTDIGTGGTPFMKYLAKHVDEVAAHRL